MKVFISDLHLGCGDELEDFILWRKTELPLSKTSRDIQKGLAGIHRVFSHFIDHILDLGEKKGVKPEIVLLGDTFDLLQVLPEERTNPQKIDLIAEVHKSFFDSLARFHEKGGCVNLVAGNHDHDLLHPELSERLRFHLPFINETSSGKPLLYYHDPASGIYAEHGNQYDMLNAFENPANPDEWPLGSELLVNLVNPLERSCPVIDNLGVRESLWYAVRQAPGILSSAHKKEMLLLEAVQEISRENRLKHLAYFLLHRIVPGNRDSILNLLWNLLYANDEILRTAAAPKHILRGILYTFATVGRNPLRIFQEILRDRLKDAARKILRGEKEGIKGTMEKIPQFVIFGHTHKPCMKRVGAGRGYANSGSWKMKAAPKGKLSLKMEQSLDYVLAQWTKKRKWTISVNSWAEMEKYQT
ncbi:hypothetical protein JW926_06885 [Candidatus Sumerlaeota bacterium]|nr:hypothetical protein [Candidatus Sumerlaeota bacterium]